MMSGEALKAFRLDAGLTQGAAATRYGVKQSAWANYESGKRAVPPTLESAILGGPTVEIENNPEALLRKFPAAPVAKAKAIASNAAPAGIREAAIAANVPIKWAKALEKRNARRPTAAEVRGDPRHFAGPNVWVMGDMVWKFAANGHGWPSVRMDREAPGFIPNAFKDGGDNPKAPPAARKRA